MAHVSYRERIPTVPAEATVARGRGLRGMNVNLRVASSTSKVGMESLTETRALEYAGQGIRVNAITPGATVAPIDRVWIDDPVERATVESHIPMGRAGTADEMAGVTCFLASEDAACISGQTIFVDGGLTLFADFRAPWSSE